ncbi:MAG: ABC transporter ATP-binding protein [Actinomyces succiniciruminis]|uniref:Abc transporter n=2 Tax=Actinomyces TaxID=1654 RepID=A0A1M4RYF3_9ACTO|nr:MULTISPECIES: ATP-binding cassette domain-containing protein [Actinomyces]MBM6980562.1 ABC transporter ATP-binding protein [Actinomyces succiniciruminis]CED89950.1 Glutathione import ATP-binding protein GsiA [Actinomyces succiniciruminis]SHE25014.1 abc transporter [Actinomyces glycerinitolerans]
MTSTNAQPPSTGTPLLEVDELVVTFPGAKRGAGTTVIHGVSLDLHAGETLSVVGESGSGKTTIGRAILGLAPVSAGEIRFRGRRISNVSRAERRAIARDIQVVFQDPYTSLNPAMRIGDILTEPLQAAGIENSRKRVLELLDAVNMPADTAGRYPREFSGGQRQRIAIARALALDPAVIICDEPTSALDVTTQARVLTLFEDIQQATGVAYLFISHDLGVVNRVSDRIAVLYQGRIVELGDAHQVATAPAHEYTRRLQMAAPVADPVKQRSRRRARLALAHTA